MSTNYEQYAPRLAEIIRELLRTTDVEAWMDAYCALCAEAVPGEVDDIDGVARHFALPAMKALSISERVRFTQILLGTPDLIARLRAKIQAIKAQKGMPS